MKKVLILFACLSLLVACKKKETRVEEKQLPETEKKASSTNENSKIGRNNYVVIWKWTTTDVELVEDNLVTISDEINRIWKRDIITDAYYNSDSKIDKLAYFPNVSFVIKSKSPAEAEAELNKLILVKKGIASYSIHKVGTKWLSRDSDMINDNGISLSYAAVWNTKDLKKASDDLIKTQSDAILKLWNKGKIENVYFDIQGTQHQNDITDFVFYINVNTEEEAKVICNELPFYKENIASFKLHDVGVFWLGDNNY